MNRFSTAFAALCANKFFPLVFLPIAALYLSFFSYATSPFFLHEGMDTSVFKTMGLALLHGKVPYVDIFDHKGPVLYAIFALGQFLHPGNWGIFIIQTLCAASLLTFLFLIAKSFISPAKSFLVVLLSLFFLTAFIEEGGQCEEWGLYFSVPALYLCLRLLRADLDDMRHLRLFSFIIGACFAAGFLIRPNDAVSVTGASFFGVLLFWFIRSARPKAVTAFAFAAIGVVLVLIPFVAWFAYHSAFMNLLDGLLLFNLRYAGTGDAFNSDLNVRFARMTVLLLGGGVFSFFAFRNNFRRELFILLPGALFTALLIGSRLYPHYYITTLPLICLFLTAAFLASKPLYTTLLIALLCVFPITRDRNEHKMTLPYCFKQISMRSKLHHRQDRELKPFYREVDALIAQIPQQCRDSVWNYNLSWGEKIYFSSLWRNDIIPCSFFTYRDRPMIDSDVELQKKDDLRLHRPLYLLICDNSAVMPWDSQVIMTDYDFVAQTDPSVCNLWLFVRKDANTPAPAEQ